MSLLTRVVLFGQLMGTPSLSLAVPIDQVNELLGFSNLYFGDAHDPDDLKILLTPITEYIAKSYGPCDLSSNCTVASFAATTGYQLEILDFSGDIVYSHTANHCLDSCEVLVKKIETQLHNELNRAKRLGKKILVNKHAWTWDGVLTVSDLDRALPAS